MVLTTERVREPLDLRLAAGAGAAWLAVLGCVDGAAGPCLVLAALAAVVSAAALITGRRGGGRATSSIVALIAGCVAIVLLPLAARIAQARASPLAVAAAAHRGVTLELTVDADPRPLAATGPGGSPRVAVEAEADVLVGIRRREPVGGSVLLLADAAPWRDVLPGQRVRVEGVLGPELNGGALSVTLFVRHDPVLLGRPPWWQRAAGRTRSALRAAVAGQPPEVRGLLPGLIVGDTSALDPVLAEHFRTAGLTHLVAVSGTNCSLVVVAVLALLRRARVRPWICALAGVLVLAMFVVIARPSPSVLRAALMAGLGLVALASGRPRSALPGLAAVVIILLLWDPTLAGSISFTLSVLATAALLVLAPGWGKALRERGVPAGLAESVAVAAAAHLVTAPVIAAISGRVSVTAVVANVLAEPVVAVTTVVGFVAALLAPLWLGAAEVLVWIAGWPTRWLAFVADLLGSSDTASVPWPGGVGGGLLLGAVLLAVLVLAMRSGVRRLVLAAGLTAAVVIVPVRSVTSLWPPAGWALAACDVGQGDALALHASAGAAVVIDAGPDPVRVDRCLHDLDVRQIPLLVLTHLHMDHVAGIDGVGHHRRVGTMISGPLDAPETGATIAHRFAAGQHLAIRTPTPGTRLVVGDLTLDVLGPQAAFHGTRSDPNNSSLVLRAEVGGTRIMLPGDAEVEAQDRLVAAGLDLRADILKVAHHGSAYFAPQFLDAVAARVAVISVGLHNDYGHPSPVLLGALAQRSTPVLRTDHDGDVAFVPGTGGQVTAVTHQPAGAAAVHAGERAGRPPAGAGPVRVSALDARMGSCQHVRSVSTTSPFRCPASSWSSVTRSCWSTVPSARSPPLPAAPIPA